MGDRRGVLAREMTKLHEEFLRGHLSTILEAISSRTALRGECTLMVEGRRKDNAAAMDLARAEMKQALAAGDRRLSEIVKDVTKAYDLPRNMVYQEALSLEANRQEEGGSPRTHSGRDKEGR